MITYQSAVAVDYFSAHLNTRLLWALPPQAPRNERIGLYPFLFTAQFGAKLIIRLPPASPIPVI